MYYIIFFKSSKDFYIYLHFDQILGYKNRKKVVGNKYGYFLLCLRIKFCTNILEKFGVFQYEKPQVPHHSIEGFPEADVHF